MRTSVFSCFQHGSGLFSQSSSNCSVFACADTRTTLFFQVRISWTDGSPVIGESRRSLLQRQWLDPRVQRIS
jgi:hypothetical protein